MTLCLLGQEPEWLQLQRKTEGRHSRFGGAPSGREEKKQSQGHGLVLRRQHLSPTSQKLARGSPTAVPKRAGTAGILPCLPPFPCTAPSLPAPTCFICVSVSPSCTTFLLSFLLFPLERRPPPPGLLPEKPEIRRIGSIPTRRGFLPSSHPPERHKIKASFHSFITNFAPQGPQKGTKLAFLCFSPPHTMYKTEEYKRHQSR